MIMWVMWAALTSGFLVIQFILGGGLPQGKNPPTAGVHPIAIMGVVLVIIATGIRWFVLPRFAALNQKLVMMIVGMALSEGAGINGIFLIPASQPETKLAIFVLSLLGMVQFAPIYARSGTGSAFR
jgi:hypothetical protein